MKISIAIFAHTMWLCLFFCGCLHKKSKNTSSLTSSRTQKKSNSLSRIYEQEAKFSDIPHFLAADPLREYFEESNLSNEFMVGYTSAEAIENITSFYESEMEQLGWKQVFRAKGMDTIMLFEKPSRWCTITLRRAAVASYNTDIVIAVVSKEEDQK